jgi:hypothetical protein
MNSGTVTSIDSASGAILIAQPLTRSGQTLSVRTATSSLLGAVIAGSGTTIDVGGTLTVGASVTTIVEGAGISVVNGNTVSNTGVLSLDTATGAITIGPGLTRTGQQLQVRSATTTQLGSVIVPATGGLSVTSGTLTNAGVISLAGGTGTLTLGTGIARSGQAINLQPATTAALGGIIAGSGLTIDGAGTLTTSGGGGGGITSAGLTFTGGLLSVANSPLTGAGGTLAMTVAGTAGGVPYFSTTSAWASSGALTNNSVVLGGGASGPKTSTGITTDGAASLTIGVPGSVGGSINFATPTGSNYVAMRSTGASGTYNFNLPLAIGTAGQVLTTSGANGTPFTWTTPVATSVGSGISNTGGTLSIAPATALTLGGIIAGAGTTIDAGGTLTVSGGGGGGSGGASITVSDTAPASPTDGAMWFDSVGLQLYLWYNDGSSSQWVPASNYGSAFTETAVAMAASNIDLSAGTLFYKVISVPVTLTVSNVAPTGRVSSFVLELTNGGVAAITWWAGVKWAGGPPALTASGVDALGFYTRDGGTTWRGAVLWKDSK